MSSPTTNRADPRARLLPYLRIVAEIHKTAENTRGSPNLHVQRIFGGANNALYKIETPDETLACKLCVADGRQRAAREFGALSTLQAAGMDIAPEPIFLDESQTILPYPIVIYRWVDGATIKAPLSHTQLDAFLGNYQRLHSFGSDRHPAFQLTAWFHWFEIEAYLTEIHELADLYTPWLTLHTSDGPDLNARLKRILWMCAQQISNIQVEISQNSFPLRLVRVDPNTANAILGPNGNIRWVDWEYSGWGDPALDLAELRWHAALQPLGQEALQWLRTNYKPASDDPDFWGRVLIWDHILATRWPFLVLRFLWSNHNGPDRERLSRVETPSEQLYQRLRTYIQRAEALFAGDTW